MITGPKISAALALLRWSYDDLMAASALSRATVCRAATSPEVPRMRIANLVLLQKTLEANGIEFLKDGVRLIPEP